MTNYSNNNEALQDTKLEIITKAIENDDFDKIREENFFKHFEQLEKKRNLVTADRIWLGRRLKQVFTDSSAPNHGRLAIFQPPNEFKKLREWERKTGWNGFSKTV